MKGGELLFVGVEGTRLARAEATILKRVRPAGIVLVQRNVADEASLRALISELRAAAPGLVLALDAEGGRVDRLRALVGPAPGADRLAAHPPALARRAGYRVGAALAGFGIDLDYLLVVHAANAADRLWAVEQTLKSTSFGALLAWLPQDRTRPEHLRRMQLATQGAQGPAFLFRPVAAQFEPSPAPLRLLLAPKPDQQLSVQLLKRRGPVLASPILIGLPQPVAAISLRPRPSQQPADHSLATAHVTAPPGRPVTLN